MITIDFMPGVGLFYSAQERMMVCCLLKNRVMAEECSGPFRFEEWKAC